MQSTATTVDAYLGELPEDRRVAIQAVREVIVSNLGKGYQEGMQYGMIGYFVPHSVYPPGYHCNPKQPLPFASLASQKNHMAIYLFCIYGSEEETERFQKAWLATGMKLDMGKGCVRFKRLEDVPLEVVGEAIRRMPVDKFVARYESNIKKAGGERAARKSAASTPALKKPTSKKPAAKKVGTKVAGNADKKVSKRPATKTNKKVGK